MKALTKVWKDRSIGVKLGALAAVGVVGLVASGGGGLAALEKVEGRTSWLTGVSDARSSWQGSLEAEQGMLANVRLAVLISEHADAAEIDKTAVPKIEAYRKVFLGGVNSVIESASTSKEVTPKTLESLKGVGVLAQDFSDTVDALLAGVKARDLQAQMAADNHVMELEPQLAAAFGGISVSMEQKIAGALDDIDAAKSKARVLIVTFAGIATLLLVFVAFAVRRAVVNPIRIVQSSLSAMARGDMTVPANVDSRDEIGKMAAALTEAQAGVREAIGAVARSATQVNESSQHLSQATTQISVAAEQVTAQAGAVAAASGQISGGLQTVAAGSEEMGASIGEIARNATSAANVAAEAVEVAAETNRAMSELSDSSVEIGKVVGVITSIAEQTNMLALNATIEAARAGDAGKGFAVVAHEVKDLAQETAEATAEITNRVGQIQGKAEEAVAAIAKIGEIIGRINDYQGTIASAVEEQTATTAEINKNMSQAATGSAEISTNVDGVASAARLTSENVAAAQSSADELAQLSSELRDLVGRFTV